MPTIREVFRLPALFVSLGLEVSLNCRFSLSLMHVACHLRHGRTKLKNPFYVQVHFYLSFRPSTHVRELISKCLYQTWFCAHTHYHRTMNTIRNPMISYAYCPLAILTHLSLSPSSCSKRINQLIQILHHLDIPPQHLFALPKTCCCAVELHLLFYETSFLGVLYFGGFVSNSPDLDRYAS